MLAFKDGPRVRLISRQNVDHTEHFRELASAIAGLKAPTLLLDGEVCVFAKNLVSQFHLLDRSSDEPCTPPVLMAFDCLHVHGLDVRSLPLHRRRYMLEQELANATIVYAARRLPDRVSRSLVSALRGYGGPMTRVVSISTRLRGGAFGAMFSATEANPVNDTTDAELIRAKVRSGTLPLPANPPAKCWVGKGTSRACDGCDKIIAPDEIEYELDLTDGRALRLHVDCLGFWHAARAEQMTEPPKLLAGLRILVVDDHEDSRDLLQQAFGFLGADVTTAVTAEEAMRSVTTADVVVTDFALKGNDGAWLLAQINSSPRPVPVVLCRASSTRARTRRSP